MIAAANRTASFGPVHKNSRDTQMAETTNPGGENFRRIALVLMIVLIAFGVLELAGVFKV